MRKKSEKKFGRITVPIEQLRVIYAYDLKDRIDVAFAEEGVKEYLDIPIIIDRNNYIIDGHHRYWYFKKHNVATIDIIRLDITFEESRPWRTADVSIKQFSRFTGKHDLYKQFKELVKCLE